MLTSGKYNETRREILTEWSMLDLLNAHAVLDMYQELDEKAAASAEKPR